MRVPKLSRALLFSTALVSSICAHGSAAAEPIAEEMDAAAKMLRSLDAAAVPTKPQPAPPSAVQPSTRRPPELPVFTLEPAPLNPAPHVAPEMRSQEQPPLDEAEELEAFPYIERSAPVAKSEQAKRTQPASVRLGTSAPQRIDGSLSISVIQAAFRRRQVSLSTAVLNQSRTAYRNVELRFSMDGGGRRIVRISELRPGQTRNVNVRVALPRGNRPDTITVTSVNRHATRSAERGQASR